GRGSRGVAWSGDYGLELLTLAAGVAEPPARDAEHDERQRHAGDVHDLERERRGWRLDLERERRQRLGADGRQRLVLGRPAHRVEQHLGTALVDREIAGDLQVL